MRFRVKENMSAAVSAAESHWPEELLQVCLDFSVRLLCILLAHKHTHALMHTVQANTCIHAHTKMHKIVNKRAHTHTHTHTQLHTNASKCTHTQDLADFGT